jgi:Fic family protein
VKPEPPDDLWDKLDAAYEAAKKEPDRPCGSFTTPEYAKRHGLSNSAASVRILRLIEIGAVQRHGSGNRTYYTLCTTQSPLHEILDK